MKVQFLATEEHFSHHLRPVYDALPEEVRGKFCTKPAELEPKVPTVVASYGSLISTTGQPIIFFEHGAGFQYNTKHASYAGSQKRDKVILFCNVNEFVAESNRKAHPSIQSVVVGCPKLDKYAAFEKPVGEPKVAFSWHWDAYVVPETRSAWPHYSASLRQIARNGKGLWTPLGHAHPRAHTMVKFDYGRLGWKYLRKFEDVCRQASVYVCDTSSTIYEFAALDRPVVVLNAPWYRKTVHHGLRFWDHIPGIQVDHPKEVNAAVEKALINDTWKQERKRISNLVYPNLGCAALKASEAILTVL